MGGPVGSFDTGDEAMAQPSEAMRMRRGEDGEDGEDGSEEVCWGTGDEADCPSSSDSPCSDGGRIRETGRADDDIPDGHTDGVGAVGD